MGRMIKVAATATAGTTIHTGSATATTFDEVWLYAVNSDTTASKLTIEWGGVSSPDDLIEFTVPAESGLYLDCSWSCYQRQRNTACCAGVLCVSQCCEHRRFRKPITA
jgi:hypothetical protein